MPVYMVDHPAGIFPAIHSTKRPTIAHYWPPRMGKESPATVFFDQVDEYLSGVMDFVIIESGVCPPKHDREEMPLTVLYVNWEEKGSAPYEAEKMQELIESAFPYLE